MAENRPAPPPACTIRSPPGRNLGSVAPASDDSGTPSAMPPAPCTISAPGSCSRGVQLLLERARGSSPPRRTPGRARARRRGWRRTRAAASGGATVRRHAASDDASDSGVAGLLVDDAARALAGEERDASIALRRRPRLTESGSHGEPSSSSAKQNDDLAGVAVRGPVDLARPAAADVADDELQGAADRDVGPVALPEHVDAAVHPDGPADRAVHDDDRTDRHRGGQHAVDVELVGARRLDAGQHHRAGTRAGSRPSPR